MKALDTPILLALLEGDRAAQDAIRRFRGHEVATTEANLLELVLIAGGTGHARGARREAIGRLRRRLTVLPLDASAVNEIGRRAADKELARLPLHVLAMLGALEASGCEELLTDQTALPGKWRFKISHLRRSKN